MLALLKYICCGFCVPSIKQKNEPEKESFIEKIKWNDTIPFIPPTNNGHVIKVYDGDTITIATKLPFNGSPLYRFSVRLNGIDSPEIKGKTEEEKLVAKKSQKALEDLIFNKTIHLKNVSTEKYGRVLADVYLDDLHVNKWLLDGGYAVKYDGGKKQNFDDMNLSAVTNTTI